LNQDFYSFTVESLLDDDCILYAFKTSSGTLYNVYFRPNEYDKYVDNFPNLLTNYYGFGFFRLSRVVDTPEKDPKVFITISKIITDFLSTQPLDVILLYHCDHVDGKQGGRERIFSRWYEASTHKQHIIKHSVHLLLNAPNETATSYYMGYLTATTNPLLKEIQSEFDLFVEYLIIDKS
jgi:hypothetical protein